MILKSQFLSLADEKLSTPLHLEPERDQVGWWWNRPWLWNKNRPNQFSTGNRGKRYMYATTREEKEIMIPNHGLFPLFLDTDGLSRIQADKEIRRLTQARY
jgi:hypothetical protein